MPRLPRVCLSTCTEAHRTHNRYFSLFGERAIHGGTNPMLERHARGPGVYFVSVFHTKDRALQYQNYAYTFAAEPPFRITAVSRRPLVLRGKRVRFVSSLSYLGFHAAANVYA